MGASFSVFQQADDTWGWRIIDDGRRHVMSTFPGYATACDAANAAVALLGSPYKGLAARLAANYATKPNR